MKFYAFDIQPKTALTDGATKPKRSYLGSMKITASFEHEEIKGFKFGSQPVGKPRMFSHIYFVDGLLIDTGHSNMKREVLQTVGDLKVDQIFLTHHHEDHTGNLGALQEHFECPSYASAKCAGIMRNPPGISLAQWLIWGEAPPNTNILVKEDVVMTANHTFRIIPIPGHAVDMVALFEPERRWLFSADLWVSEYIRYFMRNERMREQIESIKKILTLDFDVLLCSHNPQFEGGKEKLKQKQIFLEDFYENVAALHSRGYSAEAIMKEMKLKEPLVTRVLSNGALSTLNMVKSVIRDETERNRRI